MTGGGVRATPGGGAVQAGRSAGSAGAAAGSGAGSVAGAGAGAGVFPALGRVLSFEGSTGAFLSVVAEAQRGLIGASCVAVLRVVPGASGASGGEVSGGDGGGSGGSANEARGPRLELLAISPESALNEDGGAEGGAPRWLRLAGSEAKRALERLAQRGPGADGPLEFEAAVPVSGAADWSAAQPVVLIAARSGREGGGGGGGGGGAVFAALIEARGPAHAAQAAATLRASSLWLDAFEARRLVDNRQSAVELIADVIETVEAVTAHQRFRAAAMALCNEVAARWRGQRVTLGMLRGRSIRVEGMSQTEHLVRKTRLIHDLESAMEECAEQDIELTWPPEPDADTVTRVTAGFAQRHGPAWVVSLPLRRAGEVVGVLVVEREPGEALALQRVEVLRLLCDAVVGPIDELSRHDRWVGARAWSGTRRLAGAVVGPRHTGAKLLAIGGSAAAGVLVFGHGTDWVEAPFTLEVTRRHVLAAPFDGYIGAVHAEIGDVVSPADGPLVEMDTTDLVLRLSTLRADLNRRQTEGSVALRDGEIADRDMAAASAEAIEAEIGLVRAQLERAGLATPVEAVVIAGEPERRIGGSAQRGEVLFEVAPLDALRVEIRVPAGRIGDVAEGQTGVISAASHPTERVPVRVIRVDPVGEVREGDNAFRVVAEVEQSRGWMRPGVEGLARLEAGRAPYGWLILRDAVNWVRQKLWI